MKKGSKTVKDEGSAKNFKTLEERWTLDGDMSGAFTMYNHEPTLAELGLAYIDGNYVKLDSTGAGNFTANELASHLQKLRKERKKKENVIANDNKRRSLTKKQRDIIFLKTKGRCHICGGEILANEAWQADHVLAHIKGGSNAEENYLPAHSICNRLRWHYGAEEIQWIFKLGIWMRTQIEKEKSDTMKVTERFVKEETAKKSR